MSLQLAICGLVILSAASEFPLLLGASNTSLKQKLKSLPAGVYRQKNIAGSNRCRPSASALH
jgi:hypothetical protein